MTFDFGSGTVFGLVRDGILGKVSSFREFPCLGMDFVVWCFGVLVLIPACSGLEL